MDKQSQIQITETIVVLFVFFILMFVGLIFYLKIFKSNIESEKEELNQLNSIGVAQRVMFMPELQCSQSIVKEITNCIDIIKLDAIKSGNIIKTNLAYFDIFGFSEITISQIYPIEPGKESADPTDLSLTENHLQIYSRKAEDLKQSFSTNVPISLYDPIEKKYSFGILNIVTYS